MSKLPTEQRRELLESVYRVDSGRILATLIRLLSDFDLAEEAMHEAFAVALSLWPRTGVPSNPRLWLISTARFKAVDTLRQRVRFDASQDELVRYLEAQSSAAERNPATGNPPTGNPENRDTGTSKQNQIGLEGTYS
jgi:RNA polymerase sigma-70 factor, ECF subfamily